LATTGVNTVTYSIGGPCPDVQSIDIAVEVVIITTPVVDALCNGGLGTITVNSTGAVQYSSDGGTTFQASNVFNEPAGTYTMVGMNPMGCQAVTTVTVNEPTLLVVPMSFSDETCFGFCDGIAGTAPSGGTGAYSYAWSNGATGSPFISSLCAGSYTVTVTDANGCVQTGTTTVGGPPAINITSIVPAQPSCNGGTNGSIVITGSPTSTGYSITGGAPFFPTGTFTGLAAGTYNVVVQDAGGCTATGTTTVTEPTAVTVTPGPAVTVCQGQNATIFATGGGGTIPYTYSWTDATGAPAGAASSVTVTPTVVGANVYNVTVSDNNGCGPVTTSVTVTLNPPLTVVASADQFVCPGNSANISAVGSGGNGGPYIYTWTNNVSPAILTGSGQTVTTTTGATTFTITLSDGCSTPTATDVLDINWFTLPAVSYTISNQQGCSPVVVDFTNLTAAGASPTITWDFGDGSTGSGNNITHTFSTAGCYDINLDIVTSDGCSVDTTIYGQICVFAYPQPDFVFQPIPADVFNPEITFTNTTLGGDFYSWDFAGLGTDNATHPQFTFPATGGGTYTVCLTASTTQGCTASVCHDVVINDVFLLYVPNSFTPDGDGLNDIFLPSLQGENPETYEFRIFNRWGETIFFTTDKTIGWDGTHKNIKSKEDVYVWKVRVKKSINQEVIEKTGNVNLLR
jgi:large repetitive protein